MKNGYIGGVDFGVGQWRWEGATGPNTTNHLYLDSSSGTLRTFRFSGGAGILTSVEVFTPNTGTLTLPDDQGQTVSVEVQTGDLYLVETGLEDPSMIVTVDFTAGWDLGVNNVIIHIGALTYNPLKETWHA